MSEDVNENVTEFPGQYIPDADENVADVDEVMTSSQLAKALGGGDIVPVSQSVFEDDQLLNISSLDDARLLLAEAGIDIHNAEDVLGDGFELLSGHDKIRLVDKPLLLVQWQFLKSKFGPMVTAHALEITGPNPTDIRKWKLIDTSSKGGIRQDLMTYSATHDKFSGLFLRRGLRVSSYTFEDARTGENMPAETFYLNYSK